MSASEQNTSQKIEIPVKERVLKVGTTLAKSHSVKNRITYKEITLFIGILVAVIVIFTIWFRAPDELATYTVKWIPNFNLSSVKATVLATIEILL